MFTDCLDDIKGALRFVEKKGVKNIYLIGHSTGCQKSIYYLSKNIEANVKGAILLAPLSDYANAVVTTTPKLLRTAVNIAKKMVDEGKPHEMMPIDLCPHPYDAQRFLSLYTPDSVEEIFCYATPKKEPLILNEVKVPMFIVLASEDEYLERPVGKIVEWFQSVLKKQRVSLKIVGGAPHNFKGFTKELANLISDWTGQLSKSVSR